MTLFYLEGTDNTVADTLCCLYEQEQLNTNTLKSVTLRARPPKKIHEDTEPQASSLTRKRKLHQTGPTHTTPSGTCASNGQGVGVPPKPSGSLASIGRAAGGKPIEQNNDPALVAQTDNQRGDLDSVVEHMTDGYRLDPWFSDPTNTATFKQNDGLWWTGAKQIVVPDVPGLRLDILNEMHTPAYQGHPGVSKMLRSVLPIFWWPQIRFDVNKFVSGCPDCQRNKASTQRPAGVLYPLPIPDKPWDSVSMDFIVQLPPTPTRPGQARCHSRVCRPLNQNGQIGAYTHNPHSRRHC
jgi:hypothetical protein